MKMIELKVWHIDEAWRRDNIGKPPKQYIKLKTVYGWLIEPEELKQVKIDADYFTSLGSQFVIYRTRNLYGKPFWAIAEYRSGAMISYSLFKKRYDALLELSFILERHKADYQEALQRHIDYLGLANPVIQLGADNDKA